ncbi:MAG: hypothetical protein AAGD10_13355 [Myxococcota bacterium]
MRILVFNLLLLAVGSGLAQAQTDPTTELRVPAPKQGYFVELGLRSGVLAVSNDELPDLDPFPGFGGAFRFGEMTLPWLGFGGVGHVFFGSNDEFTTGFGAFSMEAQVAPFKNLDLAGRVAIGPFFQVVTREDESLALDDDPDQGFGAILTTGVSWDLFPFYDRQAYGSGGFAVSLYADGQFLLGSDFTSAGAFIGVELGYFFGLPKNKLKLPLEEAY